MTSILKVSTIQNTAGTAPTAGDLGLNVAGTCVAGCGANWFI